MLPVVNAESMIVEEGKSNDDINIKTGKQQGKQLTNMITNKQTNKQTEWQKFVSSRFVIITVI